jgi:hypothetical protein
MCRANSNMRLITGRAFRKFVFLKAIEDSASDGEGWQMQLKQLNLVEHLAATRVASTTAKEHHAQLATVLGNACLTDAGAHVC